MRIKLPDFVGAFLRAVKDIPANKTLHPPYDSYERERARVDRHLNFLDIHPGGQKWG